MQVAKAKVSEVEAGMAAMKQQHLSIMLEMDEQYKGMEADMQVQYIWTSGLPCGSTH